MTREHKTCHSNVMAQPERVGVRPQWRDYRSAGMAMAAMIMVSDEREAGGRRGRAANTRDHSGS